LDALCKQSLALMVGFLVVEPTHSNLNPRLSMGACIFLNLFQDYLALFFQRYMMCSSTGKRMW
jgi:hypothetical protein